MPYKNQKIKNILYIEDDEGLARLLQRRMEKFGYIVEIAPTGEEGIKKFREHNFDVALIDNYLPGMSGIEVLKALQLQPLDTPAIFLTSSGDERLALEALESNAADYLIKDPSQTYLDLLPSVMTAAFTRVNLLKQNKFQEQTLLEQAEQLRRSQERLDMALVGSETGVWDWQIKSGELFWSENLRFALELPRDEKPTVEYWFKRIHPDDLPTVQQALRDHLDGKTKSYHVIYREKARQGKEREWNWILAHGMAQLDKNGKPYRVVGTSFDFTQHKMLEEQLEEAKNRAETANSTKSDFLATMSHEIRTPMNAIIGLTDILSRTKLDSKQQEILKTIQSSSSTLLTLINDLLDISRIEANQIMLEKLPLNLKSLIDEISVMLKSSAQQKNLKLEVECSTISGMYFLGDALRINQIITNLCSNAIKFTDSGKISIHASCDKIANDNYEVTISVTDSGIGIEKNKQNIIFDKFVQADQSITRRFGGTGLGLAISHSLAEQMGGNLSVESQVGKGSTFTLTLPMQLAQKVNQRQASESDNNNTKTTGNRPTILLVEDYTPNVLVATLLLEDMGYNYEVATNGVEAVDKVIASPNEYGVILMDVQMHAMDGFEATKAIRDLEKKHGWARHNIIGLTAHALTGDRERCLEAGMDEYITKPIDAKDLQNKIARLLDDNTNELLKPARLN